MLHGCPPSPDAWGRLNVVTPFHHLSGDSHINSSLREGPLRHLKRAASRSGQSFQKQASPSVSSPINGHGCARYCGGAAATRDAGRGPWHGHRHFGDPYIKKVASLPQRKAYVSTPNSAAMPIKAPSTAIISNRSRSRSLSRRSNTSPQDCRQRTRIRLSAFRPDGAEPLCLVPSYLGKLAPPGSENAPQTKKQRRAATGSPGQRTPGLKCGWIKHAVRNFVILLPRCDTHADLFGIDLDTNIGLARLHAVPFPIANHATARQHAAIGLEIVLHNRPPSNREW